MTCPCISDQIEIWKRGFWKRGENWSTQRKTSQSKGNNQQLSKWWQDFIQRPKNNNHSIFMTQVWSSRFSYMDCITHRWHVKILSRTYQEQFFYLCRIVMGDQVLEPMCYSLFHLTCPKNPQTGKAPFDLKK